MIYIDCTIMILCRLICRIANLNSRIACDFQSIESFRFTDITFEIYSSATSIDH